MKKGYAAIALVLDESGSMGIVRDATIEGVNSFVASQKAMPGEAMFVFTRFNQGVETVSVDRLAEFEPLSRLTYNPDGSTALYDAVCLTIDRLGGALSSIPEDERPERVLVVIQTDGMENSSRRFTKEDAKTRITHQKEKYNWEFMFLGAGQDAWLTGELIGVGALNSFSYDNTARGTQDMYSTVSAAATSLREMGLSVEANAALSREQRERSKNMAQKINDLYANLTSQSDPADEA